MADPSPQIIRGHRSRYIRAGIVVLILVTAMTGVWFGTRFILATPTPFFIVSSGSMKPALNVGDIIVVSGLTQFEKLSPRDIIVFHSSMTHDRVIVHRIIDVTDGTGKLGYKTKGDNNMDPDNWVVGEKDYIGRVIFTIPQIGLVTAWLQPPVNFILMGIVLIAIFVSELYTRGGRNIGGPKSTQHLRAFIYALYTSGLLAKHGADPFLKPNP